MTDVSHHRIHLNQAVKAKRAAAPLATLLRTLHYGEAAGLARGATVRVMGPVQGRTGVIHIESVDEVAGHRRGAFVSDDDLGACKE